MSEVCKSCGRVIERDAITCNVSDVYVVVDKRIPKATIMNKGDKLCRDCSDSVSWYEAKDLIWLA